MKKLSLLLLAFIFVWSCNKDDDSPGPGVTIPAATVDPTDAPAVSTEMGTDNPTWTEILTAVPPTNGAISIISTIDNDTLPATNGLPVSVDIDVPLGDSLSLVFGIDGANAHYEVPADPDGRTGLILRNSSANGLGFSGRLIKKRMGDTRSGSNPGGYLFVFNIPSSIKAGTFCVRFAVTNAAGDISNYITFCIRVQQRGGAGTGNLTTKPWKGFKEILYDMDGFALDTTIYGVLETKTDTLFCLNPPPDFEIVTSFESQQTLFVRFRANGSLLINSVGSFRFLNFGSECGNLSYYEDNFDEDLEGGWSYDGLTKIMTLSINGYYNLDGTYNPPDVMTLTVLTNTASKIEIRLDESEFGYYSILTLIPG
jgi:hypothetical protein